jgi:hypothetical protein
MTVTAAVAHSEALDVYHAAQNAARQALRQVKVAPLSLGFVVVSGEVAITRALSGASVLLGDAPLLGFSTSGALSREGFHRRSVVVALLAGDELNVQAGWWPDNNEDSSGVVAKMLQSLRPNHHPQASLLLVADGTQGDYAQLCAELDVENDVAGCLAADGLHRGYTYQIGGRKSGSAGLAAALIDGPLSISMGMGHGWRPAGPLMELSDVEGLWLRGLDGRSPGEVYADLFGFPGRDWSSPPLSTVIRQYPLGIETGGGLVIRSPLQMESDGSLRMNTVIPQGAHAHLMVGSHDQCLQAARQAAEQALAGMRPSSRPVLALAFVDVAWQTLFQATPADELAVIREVLGEEVPIAGGYTYGQIAHTPANGGLQLLNQHLEVILLAEDQSQ